MRPKVAYRRMATTDLEFEYYLAEQLGMTVGKMRREMSAQEYLEWQIYYGRKAQKAEMRGKRGG